MGPRLISRGVVKSVTAGVMASVGFNGAAAH